MPVITVGDITVPDVTGLLLADAIEDIEDLWLDYSATYSYTGTPGTILSQVPTGGTAVTPDPTEGYTVALTVSGIFPLSQMSSEWVSVVRDLDLKRPNPPGGFNAQTSSETQQLLGWSAAVDPQGTPNEKVSGIASYEIWRNGAFRTFVAAPTLSFLDTGLTAYTVYSYTIRAIDVSGNVSMFAAAINPRTLDLTAPTVPTVTATQTGQTTISVALTTASTDSGSGV